jgi:hypothetical protein
MFVFTYQNTQKAAVGITKYGATKRGKLAREVLAK